MRPKTWKVLELGPVPADAPMHPMCCMHCGVEAMLPMIGTPIAQMGDETGFGGIVFDIGGHATPSVIQCRSCKKVFASEDS